jgi:DNA mismatch repair protein MutL
MMIEVRDAEVGLRGIIGMPELARPTARYQYLYLNARPIRDKFVQHALREAYRGLTEPGRHPAAVLLLDMPSGDVDVNVHPTKAEVRFRDSGRVHGLVISAVRERLLGSDLTPRAVPFQSDVEPVRQDLRERLAAFFKSAVPADGTASSAVARASQIEPAPPERLPQVDQWLRSEPSTSQPPLALSPMPSIGATPPPEPARPDLVSSSLSSPPSPASISDANPTAGSGAGSAGGAIQLHNSYLVAQSDDGMIIIDQHALHERIMYEELRARIVRGPLESQRLLIPEVIRASNSSYMIRSCSAC